MSKQKPKPSVNNTEFKSKAILTETKPVYDPFRTVILIICLIATLLVYLVIGIVILWLKKEGYYEEIKKLIASEYGAVYVGVGLGAIGYLLYLFKQKQQFWYGIFELGFAVVSIAIASDSIHKSILIGIDLSILIAPLSALYLCVRGATNIAEGRGKSFYWKERLVKYV